MQELSNHQITRIAAEGIVSLPTVRKVLRGGGSEISRERVHAACLRLGISAPALDRTQVSCSRQSEAVGPAKDAR